MGSEIGGLEKTKQIIQQKKGKKKKLVQRRRQRRRSGFICEKENTILRKQLAKKKYAVATYLFVI